MNYEIMLTKEDLFSLLLQDLILSFLLNSKDRAPFSSNRKDLAVLASFNCQNPVFVLNPLTMYCTGCKRGYC